MTTILVGHVTKDGAIARAPARWSTWSTWSSPSTGSGTPPVFAAGARHQEPFGPADEIGCFEIGDEGVVGIPDPFALFVSRRSAPVPGSCVTVTLEGSGRFWPRSGPGRDSGGGGSRAGR